MNKNSSLPFSTPPPHRLLEPKRPPKLKANRQLMAMASRIDFLSQAHRRRLGFWHGAEPFWKPHRFPKVSNRFETFGNPWHFQNPLRKLLWNVLKIWEVLDKAEETSKRWNQKQGLPWSLATLWKHLESPGSKKLSEETCASKHLLHALLTLYSQEAFQPMYFQRFLDSRVWQEWHHPHSTYAKAFSQAHCATRKQPNGSKHLNILSRQLKKEPKSQSSASLFMISTFIS